MGVKKLKEGEDIKVRTLSGLDVKLLNDSLEAELEGMPFGMTLELVDANNINRTGAPAGAYYRITFYKADTFKKTNEMKASLPGAIYLTSGGVMIRGAKPLPGTNRSSIDYSDCI